MWGVSELTEDLATAAITPTAPTAAAAGPVYDFQRAPYLTHTANEFCGGKKSQNNYLKGCKWSPDGTCILTNAADSSLRIFNVPDLSTLPFEAQPWSSVLHTSEVDLVYDYCWYPKMSSDDAASSCFVTTAKTSPVHLWDAFTGRLRASYIPKNSVDAVVAANSVAVDPSGSCIYAGFSNAVRIFDISRPGEDCDLIDLSMKQEKQGGIISCMAFDPSGVDLVALGSYNRSIGIYSTDGDLMSLLPSTHTSGVTHVKFSPDGRRLYSGARLDKSIFCWDLRTCRVLHHFRRHVTTNQRIYFDLDPEEHFLCSGEAGGNVLIWDLTTAGAGAGMAGTDPVDASFTFPVHRDMVNGVSWHPHWSLLATASGQRHVPSLNTGDEDGDSDTDASDAFGGTSLSECSLKLWYIG